MVWDYRLVPCALIGVIFMSFCEAKLCRDGFIPHMETNQCYKYHNIVYLTWDSALAFCKTRYNGLLLVIKGQALFETVARDVENGDGPLWVGATDVVDEGAFVWLDGSHCCPNITHQTTTQSASNKVFGISEDQVKNGVTSRPTNPQNWWLDGKPNGETKENCLQMVINPERKAALNDLSCEEKRGFICEVPAEIKPPPLNEQPQDVPKVKNNCAEIKSPPLNEQPQDVPKVKNNGAEKKSPPLNEQPQDERLKGEDNGALSLLRATVILSTLGVVLILAFGLAFILYKRHYRGVQTKDNCCSKVSYSLCEQDRGHRYEEVQMVMGKKPVNRSSDEKKHSMIC